MSDRCTGRGIRLFYIGGEIPPVSPRCREVYALGYADMGFINDGGDNWTATFSYQITSVSSSGTLDHMLCSAVFWKNGLADAGALDTASADHIVHFSGKGAGIYEFSTIYYFTDGATISVKSLYNVDDSGVVIRSLGLCGFESGTQNCARLSCALRIHNENTTITALSWMAFDSAFGRQSILATTGSTLHDVLLPDYDQINLAVLVTLDPVQWTDLDADELNRIGCLALLI